MVIKKKGVREMKYFLFIGKEPDRNKEIWFEPLENAGETIEKIIKDEKGDNWYIVKYNKKHYRVNHTLLPIFVQADIKGFDEEYLNKVMERIYKDFIKPFIEKKE